MAQVVVARLTWTIKCDYAIDCFCFDTIDNIVTNTGHPVAVQKNLDVWLRRIQQLIPIEALLSMYISREFFLQLVEPAGSITRDDSGLDPG